MKVVKYLLIFALPILLFFNLWRLANLGDDYTYRGLKTSIDYMSTYPGWETVASCFTDIADAFTDINNFADILYAAAAAAFGPVYVLGAIIADIAMNIAWFFGWIYTLAFDTGYDYLSSFH